MKIFIYCRKSTESEDRQIQSIQDQLTIMRRRAKDLWHTIVEEFTESMSAKKPWRYKFNEMVDRIEKWEVEWVIAWKIDRLSRNPVDTWRIQFMLQNDQLSSIITSDREYNPCDAGLLFSVESWMANQYIMDLKKNVTRWLNSKAEKGWRPWVVPEWYRNCRETGTIVIDEINFKLIRKMFDLFLSGNYNITQIRDKANNEWWFRTKKKKRIGGNPLSQSWIYRMFWNIFYTWSFEWNGELYPWKHAPILSILEYKRIQELLWNDIKKRVTQREYSYTWMIRCWECWCGITAEDKFKHVKSSGKTHHYIYYHCTRKKPWHKCTQKVITLEKLEQQISDIVQTIEILPKFKKWALDIIKRDYHKELEEREMIYKKLQSELKVQETKLHNLTDLLLEERIDKDDFDSRKVWIKEDIKILKEQIDWTHERRDDKIDRVWDFFEYVQTIGETFNNWDVQTRREIFNSLGQNYILNDWKLAIELYPWMKALETSVVRLRGEYKRIETIEKSTTKVNSNAFNGVYLQWFGM